MSQEIIENKTQEKSLENQLKGGDKPDEKIRICLDFMKEALNQKNRADFKVFWEAKNQCIQFFKQDLSPYIRERLWKEYLEINTQEKTLKKHLEEESNFAKQQLLLAIEALEKEIKNPFALLVKATEVQLPNLPINKEVLSENQKEITLLKKLIVRLKGLKAELLGLQIRYKEKKELLEKLSELGDLVFPRFKLLTAELSDTFAQDVKTYQSKLFPKLIKTSRYYDVKNTIKDFQNLAKTLAVNSEVFQSTRKMLSDLWDAVKKLDDQRKKVSDEKKEIFTKNTLVLQEKIDQLIADKAQEKKTEEEILKEASLIFSQLKTLELAVVDQRKFKQSLDQIQNEILGKKAEESALKALEEKKQIDEIKNLALALIREENSLDNVNSKKEQIKQLLAKVKLTQSDQELVGDLLDTAQVYDTNSSFEALETFINQVKVRIKKYKHVLGVSAQDFEKAFIYQELLEKEQEQFSRLEKTIELLEEKEVD